MSDEWVDVPEDEWQDAPSPAPADNSYGYRLKNNLAAAVNAAFPLADEGAAGLRSMLPGYQNYDSELAAIRGQEKQYKTEHPYQALASSLAGVGATIPAIPTAMAARATQLAKGLQGAGEGLAYGGLTGFGAGEGGVTERLESAKKNAILGALIGGAAPSVASAVGAAGKAVGDAGRTLRRASYGAQKGDFMKTGNAVQSVLTPDGVVSSRTKASLDDLIESEALGASRDPVVLLENKMDKAGAINDEVNGAIQAYDNAGGPAVMPTFQNARDFITAGKAPANQVKAYQREIDTLEKGIQQHGNGKLAYLQEQKKAIGDKWRSDSKKSSQFYRELYTDIKESIEGAVPEVENLNKELQKYIDVDPILRRARAAKENEDAITKLYQFMRTSGGVGVPILAGVKMGHPILGTMVGAGIRLAQTPRGKDVIGKGLVDAGEVAQFLGEEGSNSLSKLAQALLAQTGE